MLLPPWFLSMTRGKQHDEKLWLLIAHQNFFFSCSFPLIIGPYISFLALWLTILLHHSYHLNIYSSNINPSNLQIPSLSPKVPSTSDLTNILPIYVLILFLICPRCHRRCPMSDQLPWQAINEFMKEDFQNKDQSSNN